MGMHSTLFGPLKFSVLPQYLRPGELVGGNGLIEMGTFVSIILGQVAGTVLVNADDSRISIVLALLACALAGRPRRGRCRRRRRPPPRCR
ncbi:hypothetical protein ACFSQE_03360 [Vogesella fluminis]|uniref:hypothetical protein n=1 Tax=Vogesella fluminis TaxID=1069161 RepID=UPI0036398765